ncbi:hypothetical protein DFJ74DRAFT_753794 [Hyaloraphidium curvatum]|nr:hypothetical protein DFJ74DRAFT_753794 [Hyaloraphidium curvatum]
MPRRRLPLRGSRAPRGRWIRRTCARAGRRAGAKVTAAGLRAAAARRRAAAARQRVRTRPPTRRAPRGRGPCGESQRCGHQSAVRVSRPEAPACLPTPLRHVKCRRRCRALLVISGIRDRGSGRAMSAMFWGRPVPFLLAIFACLFLSANFFLDLNAFRRSRRGPSAANCPLPALGSAWTAAAPACRSWSYPSSTNTVCAVVRSFHRHLSFLPTFMSALSHGSVPFKLFFVVTDPATDRAEFGDAVGAYAGGVLGCPDFAQVLTISEEEALAVVGRELDPLLPRLKCLNGTCWDRAYAFTDAALDALLGAANDRNPHGCRWLLVTNGDNLYATAFADQLRNWMDGGGPGAADLIGFDFVSRYWNPNWTEWLPDVVGIGPSHPKMARFEITGIDLGAALVSVPYLLRQGLGRSGPPGVGNPPLRMLSNHAARILAGTGDLEPELKATRADGHWMEELAGRLGEEQKAARKSGVRGGRKRKVIVRRILMFHQ